MDNGAWSFHLIDQMICQGVTRFCIAPGSRSTPLALAAARHPKAEIFVHPDERGLGFFALGCALGTTQCAALIATSGTAVGNLLPSVMEAKHSSIPLLLLTADRPSELRDCGANQTTDQIKIFQNFLVWQTDLPPPDASLSEEFVRSQVAFAVSRAKIESGPVQINCQFREPLYTAPASYRQGSLQPYFPSSLQPTEEQIAYAEAKIRRAQKGLILLGRLPAGLDPRPILALGKRLGWPIFADILSRAGSYPTPEQIRQFDYAIRSNKAPAPDCVLYFGGSFVSKYLPPWIQKAKAEVLHIDTLGERIDTQHVRPARILAHPALFCEALQTKKTTDLSYLERWQEIDRVLQETIEACFSEPHPFVEPDLMRKLASLLPKEANLFLANSMPIRDAGYFCASKGPVFCNRGLSGIDGQIATAAGLSLSTQKPTVAVLGDQSSLHDLNSILLLRNINTPFLLIISNNFGSGIFSHVAIAQEDSHFEKLFAASHDLQFEEAAKMFSIPYSSLSQIDQLETLFPASSARILEIFTSRKENACFQKRVLEKCCLALSEKRSTCLAEF